MVVAHPIDTTIIDKLIDDVFRDNYVYYEDLAVDILNDNHQNV